MRYEAVELIGVKCADMRWGIWDNLSVQHVRDFTGAIWHGTERAAVSHAREANENEPRFVAKPIDWRPQGPDMEVDIVKPSAWAVWDWHEGSILGDVWFASEESARCACDMLNE